MKTPRKPFMWRGRAWLARFMHDSHPVISLTTKHWQDHDCRFRRVEVTIREVGKRKK